ncbi:MAG TPA: carboxypeptidase-like regulatory domain-containing protein [Mycobacteriales bacterium]|nr:carboxypeptidase-like regulatory domain-containing protein [Mycobacteriales bacterium]
MNELPRREPTPLYAEAGSFERTLRRARRRRARAAGLSMAAVLAICTGGAIALATTNTEQPKQAADVPSTVPTAITASATATGPSARPTPTTGPGAGSHQPGSTGSTQGSSASASPGSASSGRPGPPGASHSTPTGSNPSTSETGSNPGASKKAYHGVAVDRSGKPLAHVRVYLSPPEGKPQLVGETADDGSFQAPCTGEPVLLASKSFGPAGSDTSSSDSGYTYVGNSQQPPDCGSTAQPMAKKTVVPQAGTIDLTVLDSSGTPVPDSDQPELYCPGVGTDPCYQPMTDADGKYTFTGLSAGTYTLRSGDVSQDYTVTAGQSTEVTWTISDTSSPTPTPTPSEPSDSSGSTSDTSSSGSGTTSASPVK